MPADGIVMAKEAFRLVEQLQGYQGEEVASYLFHAFGTNLQFEDGEFNFVKTRAEHGTKKAFELREGSTSRSPSPEHEVGRRAVRVGPRRRGDWRARRRSAPTGSPACRSRGGGSRRRRRSRAAP